MQRVKIYTIPVMLTEEKLLYVFPLPENAMVINGINVTSDLYADVGVENAANKCVGSLSLAIPEQGDVFFHEQVKGYHINDWLEHYTAPAYFKLFSFMWNDSIGYPPLGIHLTDTTFFTAYYEDFANAVGLPPQKYNVRIYLHYST